MFMLECILQIYFSTINLSFGGKMKKSILLFLSCLFVGTFARAESIEKEAFSANMVFVEVLSHSHVGAVVGLKEACKEELAKFNDRLVKKHARDYYVDILSIEVVNQKDSKGQAICFFNKITDRDIDHR